MVLSGTSHPLFALTFDIAVGSQFGGESNSESVFMFKQNFLSSEIASDGDGLEREETLNWFLRDKYQIAQTTHPGGLWEICPRSKAGGQEGLERVGMEASSAGQARPLLAAMGNAPLL